MGYSSLEPVEAEFRYAVRPCIKLSAFSLPSHTLQRVYYSSINNRPRRTPTVVTSRNLYTMGSPQVNARHLDIPALRQHNAAL